MKNRNLLFALLFFLVIIALSSCVPSGYTGQAYGILGGIWHGFIIIPSLIGKLFGMNIGIYAQHNTGFTYWLGFIIGIVVLGGGGAASRR